MSVHFWSRHPVDMEPRKDELPDIRLSTADSPDDACIHSSAQTTQWQDDSKLIKDDAATSIMRSIKYEHDFSSDPSLVDKNILARTSDRIRFDCVSKDFRCSLCLCPAVKVSHLTKLLAESMEHLPSELLLICRGRILSQRPNSSLALLEWWNILSIFIVENQREK